MFLRKKIIKSTGNYWDNIRKLRKEIENRESIIIGAGAGLSTSAGLEYGGKRYIDNFPDFASKYGLRDMYSSAFYPFETLEEYWAYWSRHILLNRYNDDLGDVYSDLLTLVYDKSYFVITTNVDHLFQKSGFKRDTLFYTQGDYGLWQCSVPCHQKTYDNETQVIKMVDQQIDMKIPSELIPYCPKCGAPMTMNLRSDDRFVQDENWYDAFKRYTDFIKKHEHAHVLFLELGVGSNTPIIIKYPFWDMTYKNKNATYACINYNEASCPEEIVNQSILIDEDIGKAFKDMLLVEEDFYRIIRFFIKRNNMSKSRKNKNVPSRTFLFFSYDKTNYLTVDFYNSFYVL